jgi:hypothetical protein
MILFAAMNCVERQEHFRVKQEVAQAVRRQSKHQLAQHGRLKETTTSTRISDFGKSHVTSVSGPSGFSKTASTVPINNHHNNLDNLILRSEFTGCPKIYAVTGSSFCSDVLSEILSSASNHGSFTESMEAATGNDFDELTTKHVYQSPFSMTSYTPLALATFAKKNFGV